MALATEELILNAMTFADAKQRFSNRVADYVRYRPGYPAGVLDLLRDECGLRSESVIADIGSGTGILSKLFLENGNRVFGVEPNREMRAAGDEFLQGYPNFHNMDSSAETITLPDASVDFVTAGQSFHWFDPNAARREFLRILKKDGWVVILWQDRRMEESPFAKEFEGLLDGFGIDYKRIKDSYPESENLRSFFAPDSFAARDLPNHQALDWEGLSGRLRSSSFTPTSGHPNFAPMMRELRRIFDAYEHEGRVRLEYFTRIYFGQLRSEGTSE